MRRLLAAVHPQTVSASLRHTGEHHATLRCPDEGRIRVDGGHPPAPDAEDPPGGDRRLDGHGGKPGVAKNGRSDDTTASDNSIRDLDRPARRRSRTRHSHADRLHPAPHCTCSHPLRCGWRTDIGRRGGSDAPRPARVSRFQRTQPARMSSWSGISSRGQVSGDAAQAGCGLGLGAGETGRRRRLRRWPSPPAPSRARGRAAAACDPAPRASRHGIRLG